VTWEETPKDLDAYQQTLDAQTAAGVDRRIAEGRARRAAVAAYRKANPEEVHERPAAPSAAAGEAAPAAAAAVAAPAGVPAAVATVAMAATTTTSPLRTAPLPTGNIPTPKKGADDKHRLLALVPPEGIQRVEREQGDRVNVMPHLLIEEFVAMLILMAGVLVFSTFLNAPLRQLANPNLTPNPSKAPWYFLGLQELLRYFHPMVAGIVIPTFILVVLAAIPYVDRNPSTKPGDRKVAMTMFTLLFCFGATLTIIGCFFRGPGYNWIWPWAQGVFFDL